MNDLDFQLIMGTTSLVIGVAFFLYDVIAYRHQNSTIQGFIITWIIRIFFLFWVCYMSYLIFKC